MTTYHVTRQKGNIDLLLNEQELIEFANREGERFDLEAFGEVNTYALSLEDVLEGSIRNEYFDEDCYDITVV